MRLAWKHSTILIFFLCLSISLFSSFLYFKLPFILPIHHVKVTGRYQHIDPKVIQMLVLPYVQTGFFNVPIFELKKKLKALAWIEVVEIRKIWPDTLMIFLKEKIPIARWGESALMAQNGAIFIPDHWEASLSTLPYFLGPDDQKEAIWNFYTQANQSLASLSLSIVSIEVSQGLSWILILSNQVKLYLDYQNKEARLQRFISIYPKVLFPKIDKVDSIDLRYEQGLAVKWKKN